VADQIQIRNVADVPAGGPQLRDDALPNTLLGLQTIRGHVPKRCRSYDHHAVALFGATGGIAINDVVLHNLRQYLGYRRTFQQPVLTEGAAARLARIIRNGLERSRAGRALARGRHIPNSTAPSPTIGAGIGPDLAAPETRKIQAKLASAKQTIGTWERAHRRAAAP
jgi:hypothetical protein